MTRSAEIKAAFARVRFQYTNERELQRGIELVLERSFGSALRRELRLSGGKNRLDFAVGVEGVDLTAIEVKTRGTLSELTRQVQRYAADPAVSEVVVIVTRAKLLDIPETLAGKPVAVVRADGFL